MNYFHSTDLNDSPLKSKCSAPVPSHDRLRLTRGVLPSSASSGWLTKSQSVTGLETNGRIPRSQQKHDLKQHLLEGTSEMSVSVSTIACDTTDPLEFAVGQKVKSSSISQVSTY